MSVITASVQTPAPHRLPRETHGRASFHPQLNDSSGTEPFPLETSTSPSPKAEIEHDDDLLVVSPYTSREHLLDLRSLRKNEQLIAKAFTVLQPVDEKYATASYTTAFNWPTVIDTLRSLAQAAKYQWSDQHLYIVVFRSQLPPTTDRQALGEMDRISHAEATKSGGLLKYWFGTPDADGRNLATCIWRDFKDARPASAGQGHKTASRATVNIYTEWCIERLKLVIRADAAGVVHEWAIEPWKD